MKTDRTFTFRGDRQYLQSASLFDDLIRFRGAHARDIDFRFSHKTDRQVSYVDSRPEAGERVVAEWTDAGGQLFAVERGEPIRESLPYDEPSLVRLLRVEGRTVEIPADIHGFSRIEALVAAFKHLLLCTYPGIRRKYVFVRIRLKHEPQGASQITYARDIGAFFQGDIRENGEIVGQIFFGVWQ
jgi:hypothetical protein